MAALICLGVFLIEPACVVLFHVVAAMYQAIAGVLQPATDPDVQFWQRITAWLLLGSLVCLGLGMAAWTTGNTLPGVWLIWILGALGLLISGLIGSLVEQSTSQA
ncbi:MAG TPA: hypothetical protein VL096_08200 [Pirellulaceae bacterium]|nr:hypothetical protein [Pirellulaceae bacterium]